MRSWFGADTPFSRLTAFVYRVAAIEVSFLVAAGPGLLGIFLLQAHASNAPLFGLFAWTAAPAVMAGIAAWEDTELNPWQRFWKAWRGGWVQSLVVTAPAVALGTLAAFNAAFAPVEFGWIAAGALVALGALIHALAALAVVARFDFRTRDLLRVAGFGLASSPASALAILSLLVLAAGIVYFQADWALVLLASLMLLALNRWTGALTHAVAAHLVRP